MHKVQSELLVVDLFELLENETAFDVEIFSGLFKLLTKKIVIYLNPVHWGQ